MWGSVNAPFAGVSEDFSLVNFSGCDTNWELLFDTKITEVQFEISSSMTAGQLKPQ